MRALRDSRPELARPTSTWVRTRNPLMSDKGKGLGWPWIALPIPLAGAPHSLRGDQAAAIAAVKLPLGGVSALAKRGCPGALSVEPPSAAALVSPTGRSPASAATLLPRRQTKWSIGPPAPGTSSLGRVGPNWCWWLPLSASSLARWVQRGWPSTLPWPDLARLRSAGCLAAAARTPRCGARSPVEAQLEAAQKVRAGALPEPEAGLLALRPPGDGRMADPARLLFYWG